jgi:superfamily II DNA or RNA helicase
LSFDAAQRYKNVKTVLKFLEYQMLNFRKLKHDVAPAILKEGKTLFDKGMVVSVKVLNLNTRVVRLSCRVMGNFDHCYESEMEIDLQESVAADSDCDCPYKYDCQHLAAVFFYLEEHFDELVIAYSKENDLDKSALGTDVEKKQLRQVIKEAATKESVRKGKKYQKELLEEYTGASFLLGQSPFFHPEEHLVHDKAEMAVIVTQPTQKTLDKTHQFEIQLSLRLPLRSKPLMVPDIKTFLDAVRYSEPLYMAGKKYFFPLASFDKDSSEILRLIMDFARIPEAKGGDRHLRMAQLNQEDFGTLLAISSDLAMARLSSLRSVADEKSERYAFPCLYLGNLEEPLKLAKVPAVMRFELEYLEAPAPKVLLKPTIALDDESCLGIDEACLFESTQPGMLYQSTYYRFQPHIKRAHLRHLSAIRDLTIPEPLFGTFVENALPELMRFAEVSNREMIERFVTLPFVEPIKGECDIHYLNEELEATLSFIYGDVKVPSAVSQLTVDHANTFITPQGVLARNLTEEKQIIDTLFQDFIYDPVHGIYSAKTEKKIVEFMTEVIPNHQQQIQFNCPENLLDQFVYDDTQFTLNLRETERIDEYEVELTVEGHMHGVTVDLLWDCLSSRRAFIELVKKQPTKKKAAAGASSAKIMNKTLVLDLEKIAPVVQIFDEIGINRLENHVERRPLWSLSSLDDELFVGLPIKFSMSNRLKEIQKQMLGLTPYTPKDIPPAINAVLRSYQNEGVQWLDRLRSMHLNGILADDMGLGKTLQAIIAISQSKIDHPQSISIIVCPTSLVYNWQEEFTKFNPNLRILVIDGNPNSRKKLLNSIQKFDVIITSYTLLQKDIEFYKKIHFLYAILDEAQHIKNRGTRNAQSVKMILANHRLILTGTPIENSLDELWSLFDFLMPGLLSSYDRFVEKYIRHPTHQGGKHLEGLRRKVSPFILRRMKKDVLSDLPPVSEIVYHCHLSEVQQKLYRSYATTAREELSQLVKKEGFDRVQIHVLATLTRLKQICCHPAIFAKDQAEVGDSAKYDMLMELLQTLIEGKHKTVIFSQYTRMLNIMREDLQKQGIRFEYLDGSSKNRLSIVKKFNEDENTSVFLVSLKAGGSGLNLVGADTVIHYDMWWNPAVENQATDRVHRLGQKQSVSSYKLITLNTIEEKILELHNRKRSLVKDIVSSDEEAIGKLTWEEVLELLQT